MYERLRISLPFVVEFVTGQRPVLQWSRRFIKQLHYLVRSKMLVKPRSVRKPESHHSGDMRTGHRCTLHIAVTGFAHMGRDCRKDTSDRPSGVILFLEIEIIVLIPSGS